MNFGGTFDLKAKEKELNKKRHLTTDENFWNDNELARKKAREHFFGKHQIGSASIVAKKIKTLVNEKLL